VRGGFAAGEKFYDALNLIKRLVNMGRCQDAGRCHPASTTHRQMSGEEQAKAGVRPEMIRLSIGIEHIDDIIGDLDQALDATKSSGRKMLGGGIGVGSVELEETACPFSSIELRPAAASARPERFLLLEARPRQQHAGCGARNRPSGSFWSLLRAAAGDVPVRLRLFALPDVPRSDAGRAQY